MNLETTKPTIQLKELTTPQIQMHEIMVMNVHWAIKK